MYKLWMEWDLGQDYYVFTSEAAAMAWADEAIKLDEGLLEEFPNGYSDAQEEGFAHLQKLTVI